MKLTPAQRLIVAADFKHEKGQPWHAVMRKVRALADEIEGTGACLKINSALRAIGYEAIEEIRARGLSIFADLKLNDIDETLTTDGTLLAQVKPEILTVMCSAGSRAIAALKAKLPNTEVLGVTVLTYMTEDEVKELYGGTIADATLKLARIGKAGGLDGFISSPKQVPMLREEFGDSVSYNTPAIRPLWHVVAGDDQNPDQIMTPEKAIKGGASRLVIGRPVLQAKNRREAVLMTIAEIEKALAA